MTNGFTIPGMTDQDGAEVVELLQARLSALIDLQLTLKHVHWNVVGPTFIGVHEMLDPHYAAVSLMVDAVAERIAALGGEPLGTPGFVAKNRGWDDYSLARASTLEHLGALDSVYSGLISDHRRCLKDLEDLDLVSQDLLIGQCQELEKFHWFVRAHLENDDGRLMGAKAATSKPRATAPTATTAATTARAKAPARAKKARP